jgi:hypothetical protein
MILPTRASRRQTGLLAGAAQRPVTNQAIAAARAGSGMAVPVPSR